MDSNDVNTWEFSQAFMVHIDSIDKPGVKMFPVATSKLATDGITSKLIFS